MTEQNPTPELPEDSQQDHFLEELAAVTGLFTPELIVQEVEQLEELKQLPEEEAAASEEADQ